MSRGDSLVRQLQLIRLLDSQRELAVEDVARDLGYSRRTVYRDLLVLERAGVPIFQERDGKRARWRVIDGYKRQLKITLSWSEMLALATGRELLAGLAGTMFHESAVSALEKIKGALPEPLAIRAAKASARVTGSLGSTHDYRRAGRAVATLVAAIEEQRTVLLEYRKPRDKHASMRKVDPYHLHVQAGALYLVGFCHQRRSRRVFLIDRAHTVEPTRERFERRAEVALADVFQGTFGPWSGTAQRVRLRFSAEVAAIVAEHRVHPSQTNQWRDDGQLDVTFNLPISPAFLAWVVGFGGRVAVMTPRALRDRVRKEHGEAAKK